MALLRSAVLTIVIAALPLAAQNPRRQSLRELSDSIETLSGNVNQAVVQIFATGYAFADEEAETASSSGGLNAGVIAKQRSSGSGVILSPDGYIITNNHVVGNARRLRVQLASPPDTANAKEAAMHAHGRLLEAKVIGIDREADLAVIKVESPTLLHTLKLADSDALHQGQIVLAFGNPLGLDNSVSLGVISSVGRQIKPDDPMVYIQTDAPINPGNSGGPLLDASGNVVGVNTFIITQSGGSEGIGFAIPSNIVNSVYQQIRKDGHVHRGEIGVTVQSITPEMAAGLSLPQDSGVIISDVAPEGAADGAGIEPGDIVLSLNKKEMHNARQFEVDLYRIHLGESVHVQVSRDGATLEMDVKVAEREDDPFRFMDLVKPEDNMVPKLGIIGLPITAEVAKLLPDTRKQYGVIVAARAGVPEYAGQGGLKAGDVIYSVNTTPVSTLEALRDAVDRLKPTDPLVVQIERNAKLLYLTLSQE